MSNPNDAFIIDRAVPRGDADLAVHAVVDADPVMVWAAARELDFLGVHTPLLDAAMWVRGVPDRIAGKAAVVPPRMTLASEGDDMLPGWVVLGSTEGRETAFGAVGRFWTPTIEWRTVAADDFAGFDEPGWGKIACAFVTLPHGPGRTMLTYECRTAITNDASRAKFRRYWWLIRPFVVHIMRATVHTIAADAEARAAS